MSNAAGRQLPVLVVLLSAILVPIVIAICFLTVLDWVNRPTEAAFTARQADPNYGRHVAARNDAIVLLYGLAQLGFVVIGAWKMTRRPEVYLY